ncbi:hypothetical protein LMG28614_05981 [Paraburkholderia ultramafica]|uniref:Uncharacterized protein n=1 Tax=Paraburkholderia ultramafica TaxID=1544867 RepID=A0A6S7DFR5_9BURK|nr:hypothetical protein [Paraburkholderia ultramafica]CAB3804211.1 hypothetical protein LMG28614_05981 [Paraburkholderia ultramafica]
MKDILDLESEELEERMAKMCDQVMDALLDGYPALSRLQFARTRMGTTHESFIVLDALPTVVRNAFTQNFTCAACLIQTKWKLARHADWEKWVEQLKAGTYAPAGDLQQNAEQAQ